MVGLHVVGHMVRRAIAEAQIIRLSVEDQRSIADSVLDPPQPNDALRRATAAHRRLLAEP